VAALIAAGLLDVARARPSAAARCANQGSGAAMPLSCGGVIRFHASSSSPPVGHAVTPEQQPVQGRRVLLCSLISWRAPLWPDRLNRGDPRAYQQQTGQADPWFLLFCRQLLRLCPKHGAEHETRRVVISEQIQLSLPAACGKNVLAGARPGNQ